MESLPAESILNHLVKKKQQSSPLERRCHQIYGEKLQRSYYLLH
nr:MAG TPA: hypothetical protein [Caudoviricetes sp.]